MIYSNWNVLTIAVKNMYMWCFLTTLKEKELTQTHTFLHNYFIFNKKAMIYYLNDAFLFNSGTCCTPFNSSYQSFKWWESRLLTKTKQNIV